MGIEDPADGAVALQILDNAAEDLQGVGMPFWHGHGSAGSMELTVQHPRARKLREQAAQRLLAKGNCISIDVFHHPKRVS